MFAQDTQFLIVTKHQLHDFLEGGAFGKDVDQETRDALKSCPLTNLSGEHAFGDLDFSMQTKRHASLHNRSSSNMLKRNRTTAWLEVIPSTKRQSILSISRKHAKHLRQKHAQQEALVKLCVQEKIAQNERLKKEKERQAAAEKERIINSVIKHGGPVKSDKQIKKISESGLEALKDQLRYLKVVLGVKINTSGNKVQLEAALSDYLKRNPIDSSPPPPKQQKMSSLSESAEHSDNSCSCDEDPSQDIFSYEHQGQWVAVYYDTNFYIGQVIDIISASSAVVKFLMQTKSRKDYFRWPLSDDIAQVESAFVYRWDFEVMPVSSDGRIWRVPEIST